MCFFPSCITYSFLGSCKTFFLKVPSSIMNSRHLGLVRDTPK